MGRGLLSELPKKKKQWLRGRLEALRACVSAEECRNYKDAEKQLQMLLTQEEVYWKQRAKQHWLSVGDGNTKFFHHYASTRRKKKSDAKTPG